MPIDGEAQTQQDQASSILVMLHFCMCSRTESANVAIRADLLGAFGQQRFNLLLQPFGSDLRRHDAFKGDVADGLRD